MEVILKSVFHVAFIRIMVVLVPGLLGKVVFIVVMVRYNAMPQHNAVSQEKKRYDGIPV